MHKKILGLCSCLFVFVLIVVFSFYFFSTYSVSGCIKYCQQETQRGATVFTRIGDGRYTRDYAYWIAANGDSAKPQELFVFRRKFLGPFQFDRYSFVTSSVQSYSLEDSVAAGSIQFTTRNDKNQKEKGMTLLFFGANEYDITNYDFSLTIREGSAKYHGNLSSSDSVWLLRFYDISNIDVNTKKAISDVTFFNSKNQKICSF